MKTLDDMSHLIMEKDKEKRDKEVDELTEDELRLFLKSILDFTNGEHWKKPIRF